MPLETAEASRSRTIEFAKGFTEEQARREASRCLRCDLAYLCPSVKVIGAPQDESRPLVPVQAL